MKQEKKKGKGEFWHPISKAVAAMKEEEEEGKKGRFFPVAN